MNVIPCGAAAAALALLALALGSCLPPARADRPASHTTGCRSFDEGKSCTVCHETTTADHYRKVNPFPNQATVTCTTCHEPYGSDRPGFIRRDYEDLAVQSRRIRPHFRRVFCRCCHRSDPVEGGTLKDFPLLLEDPTALCNRCHPCEGLCDHHPLPIVKAKWDGAVPVEYPLYKGWLTCLTCHVPDCRQSALNPKNPSFLRGGPYTFPKPMCLKCHNNPEFGTVKLHEDIQIGEACSFCHSKAPDVSRFLKSTSTRQPDLKADIQTLCTLCHEERPHPGGIVHSGIPWEGGAKQVPSSFPVDGQGRLTCATCHDPHVFDTLKWGLMRQDQTAKKMRAIDGVPICPACHRRQGTEDGEK